LQPNQTQKAFDLVWFGSKPNQINLNWFSLVRFFIFNFEI